MKRSVLVSSLMSVLSSVSSLNEAFCLYSVVMNVLSSVSSLMKRSVFSQ